MKQSNTLFIYLSPEKDDSIEDISGLNLLYKESTSAIICGWWDISMIAAC